MGKGCKEHMAGKPFGTKPCLPQVSNVCLRIRAASVGDIIEMKVTCLDDGKTEVSANIDINDVQVEFPEGHDKKIMLDDETGVIMKYPGFRYVRLAALLNYDPSRHAQHHAGSWSARRSSCQ